MGDEYVSSGGSEEEKSIDSWDQSSDSEDDKESDYGSQDNESQLKNFELLQAGTFDVAEKGTVRFGDEKKDTVGDLPDSPSPKLMSRTMVDKSNNEIGSRPYELDKSTSKFSGYTSNKSRKRKILPFNALRFLATAIKKNNDIKLN